MDATSNPPYRLLRLLTYSNICILWSATGTQFTEGEHNMHFTISHALYCGCNFPDGLSCPAAAVKKKQLREESNAHTHTKRTEFLLYSNTCRSQHQNAQYPRVAVHGYNIADRLEPLCSVGKTAPGASCKFAGAATSCKRTLRARGVKMVQQSAMHVHRTVQTTIDNAPFSTDQRKSQTAYFVELHHQRNQPRELVCAIHE